MHALTLRQYLLDKAAAYQAYPEHLSLGVLTQEFVDDLNKLGLAACGLLRSPTFEEVRTLVAEVNSVAPSPLLAEVEFVAPALHAACILVRRGKVRGWVVVATGVVALLLLAAGAKAGTRA